MKASAISNEKNQQKIVYLDGFQKPIHRATSGFLKHFHDCTGCSLGKSAKITVFSLEQLKIHFFISQEIQTKKKNNKRPC
jgi:hypothetical protein